MSSLKAIRRRIASVQNTKQITRAMKLVSAAKLRRAQDAAMFGRDFLKRIDTLIERVTLDLPDGYTNPLLEVRSDVNKRLSIVISGDRGLCGAFNVGIFKELRKWTKGRAGEMMIYALGRKSSANAKLFEFPLYRSMDGDLGDIDTLPLGDLSKEVTQLFVSGDFDEITLHYTEFRSIVRQEVVAKQLLPLALSAAPASEENSAQILPGMTVYDQSPAELAEHLLSHYVFSQLRQACLESKASEHAARMRAMDSATRNADELTDTLRLFYNRARQSAITTELLDIMGGAEALK